MTAEDLAAAYKQLIAVERGWRDCKTSLGLRPVYHHREDRIRDHVQLCWLALLLTLSPKPAPATPTQPAPRTRPAAPGHPRHRRRACRPTLGSHQRPQDHPRRPRPARTPPATSTSHPATTLPPTDNPLTSTRSCSNTTQTRSSRVYAGQRPNPTIRVPTICGSQHSCAVCRGAPWCVKIRLWSPVVAGLATA